MGASCRMRRAHAIGIAKKIPDRGRGCIARCMQGHVFFQNHMAAGLASVLLCRSLNFNLRKKIQSVPSPAGGRRCRRRMRVALLALSQSLNARAFVRKRPSHLSFFEFIQRTTQRKDAPATRPTDILSFGSACGDGIFRWHFVCCASRSAAKDRPAPSVASAFGAMRRTLVPAKNDALRAHRPSGFPPPPAAAQGPHLRQRILALSSGAPRPLGACNGLHFLFPLAGKAQTSEASRIIIRPESEPGARLE
jgi:hypothetical protein